METRFVLHIRGDGTGCRHGVQRQLRVSRHQVRQPGAHRLRTMPGFSRRLIHQDQRAPQSEGQITVDGGRARNDDR